MDVAELVTDRSARGIAAAISRAITNGALATGERLPTVRDLARALGISPTTVSEAWQVLADAGAIQARGRNGTFVLGVARPLATRRYRGVTEGPGHFTLDLSTGTPDPDLLPDLSSVLARVSRGPLTTSYLDDPVVPALAEVLRATWPFDAAALTVVDGAMDALDRIASSHVRLGDRVVVENPTFPPLLDLLEQIGAEVVGVDVDDEGIVPESLGRALEPGPVALFTQPRAHNPLGTGLSPRRAARLAPLLAEAGVLVVEDDHAGDIASSPLTSLGSLLPDRTVLVRSFSKSHGPDLRLAAVGGAAEPIERIARRPALGPGWSSRILQAVLAELLVDPGSVERIGFARDRYAARRHALATALSERAVRIHGSDGINLWIDVGDERGAQVSLAARSIGVAPGGPFFVAPPASHHLRVTVGLVRDRFDELADVIADAASISTGRPAR